MSDKLMPIMRTGLFVRFSVLDEGQAQRNHYQSLERLAERGGVSACEAIAIAERRAWRSTQVGEAITALAARAESAEIARLSAALKEALSQLQADRAANAAARDTALNEAAAALEDHQRRGREWVAGSLWDTLSREAAARIRALKTTPTATSALTAQAAEILKQGARNAE